METIRNPLLDENIFVPDTEAHVWGDGRIYLYGSYDIRGAKSYCSGEYHVYSSDNMTDWTDHGVSFRFSDISWADDCPYKALYAPDCAYKDGVYYLYYCIPDGRCGVAASELPYGPFKDVCRLDLNGEDGIDPAVFIDDDGQAYIYWGQFDRVRSAKLNPDMISIDKASITQPLSVLEHDFHEGSSVKKINGKYVFVYTDTHRHKDVKAAGMATCLGYAVSDNPQSGFEYRGVIIDNYGCDPGTWNDHGSIAEFNGQWYVFYHRSTHGSEFSRHVCAEKIEISKDCRINEVKMTSGEFRTKEFIKANYACALYGAVRIGGERLGLVGAKPGDRAVYRYITLENATGFRADGEGGPVNVYAGGRLICRGKADGRVYGFECLSGRFEIEIEFCDRRCLYGFEFL